MPNRLALIIATETFQDSSIPTVPHSESDAVALGRALEGLGFPRDMQVVLAGSAATRTAIESRLRKLSKSPPSAESLFVFFSGYGFREAGEDYLACFDTQADDLAETSVRLPALLDALSACKVQRLALFLDLRLLPDHDPLSHASLSQFGAHPGWCCFVSSGEGETAHDSGSLKSSIWAHHLVEALAGKAPLAVEDNEQMTAATLQDHLSREVPRTLRATFREAPAQTPVCYAAPGRVLLGDLGALLEGEAPTADPRLQPLQRAALRGHSTAKVKSLAGYRKFHRLPDRVNASSRKIVADLAAEDVKSDVDQVYAVVREQLGYKRRDVEGSADGGSGFVRTPDFEYSVSVAMSDDDPTTVVWRREVAGIRKPEVVLGKPFQRAFSGLFDTLGFEFARPFDLEAWVDRIEEETPKGVKLRCAADCSSCEVMVSGFAGVIRLFHDRVEVQGQTAPGSTGLVEAFLRFQELFAGRRDLAELPLLEERR